MQNDVVVNIDTLRLVFSLARSAAADEETRKVVDATSKSVLAVIQTLVDSYRLTQTNGNQTKETHTG